MYRPPSTDAAARPKTTRAAYVALLLLRNIRGQIRGEATPRRADRARVHSSGASARRFEFCRLSSFSARAALAARRAQGPSRVVHAQSAKTASTAPSPPRARRERTPRSRTRRRTRRRTRSRRFCGAQSPRRAASAQALPARPASRPSKQPASNPGSEPGPIRSQSQADHPGGCARRRHGRLASRRGAARHAGAEGHDISLLSFVLYDGTTARGQRDGGGGK